VSEGQGLEIEAGALVVLKRKAERNACTERNTARKRCWQLLRDLKAVEKGAGRELTIDELMVAFDEWHSLSASFLDPAKTRDYYLAKFFAQLAKVRVPTGEGDTLNKALEAVSKLTDSELPEIPGLRDTPESFRRVAALHREMSRLSGSKTYFLSCRDSAKAFPGLIYQQAYSINLGLVELDVIKIVCPGEHREGGKATEFRYLLPEDGNGEVE
jgi:hypothetical protein